MYVVYILLCKSDKLYTGIAKDVQKRFTEHQKGTASKFTRAFSPIKIVYTKSYTSRGRALQEEAKIKSYSRMKKISVIKGAK